MTFARTVGTVILAWTLSVVTVVGIAQYQPQLLAMETVDPKIVHECVVDYSVLHLPPWDSQSPTVWSDLEGMTLSLFVYENSTLIIFFNMQAEPLGREYNLYLWIRALVDGSPATPSELCVKTTTSREAAPLIFQVPNIGRGTHTVTIQWMPQGAPISRIGERILNVVAFSNSL